MKRSWKARGISVDAVRGALQAAGGNVTRAAVALGLRRETLSRWLRKPPYAAARTQPARRPAGAKPRTSPFGTWARRTFDLTPAEREIVRLAEAAHAMAHDPAQSASTRLAAMTQFRSCLKDLNLPAEESSGEAEDEKQKADVRPWPRRVG